MADDETESIRKNTLPRCDGRTYGSQPQIALQKNWNWAALTGLSRSDFWGAQKNRPKSSSTEIPVRKHGFQGAFPGLGDFAIAISKRHIAPVQNARPELLLRPQRRLIHDNHRTDDKATHQRPGVMCFKRDCRRMIDVRVPACDVAAPNGRLGTCALALVC
jgi:hypothetical protein